MINRGDRRARKNNKAQELNQLTETIIGAAITVHRALGPGLLESTYEACLLSELMGKNLRLEQQKALPVVYNNVHLECGYRMDLVVEGLVIVELKAIEAIKPVHIAQLLSYLKLSHLCLGLLINFNVSLLTNGVRRVVNQFPDNSASSANSAVNPRRRVW